MFTVMRTISEPASASSMHCARGAGGVGGVGVGHRLHDDRRAAADLHRARAAADADADGTMHANHGHGNTAPATGRRRDQRPSANTSRPMKCSMIASVSGGGFDEGEAGDVGDVVAVDDGAAVHDAGAHRDDLVVEGEPQIVDVRRRERHGRDHGEAAGTELLDGDRFIEREEVALEFTEEVDAGRLPRRSSSMCGRGSGGGFGPPGFASSG